MQRKTNQIKDRLPRGQRGSLAAYWGVAFLIAALYATLSYVTPYYLDDYTFMGNYRDDAEGGYAFSWSAWARYYDIIRGYDNGRISNALSPISTMFSPWKEIFPILTGIMLSLTIVLVQRFATQRRRSTGYLALTWALAIVCLPWRDTLFVRDYVLNYIMASAVTLSFLWFLRKICREERPSRMHVASCLVLAIIAGGWHEGFSATTICGLGLLAILRRFRLPRRFYAATAVYLASTLLFMLSPGIIGRIALAAESEHPFPTKNIYIILLLDAALALLYMASRMCKGRRPNIMRLPASVIVSVGITVSGYVLAFCSTATPRSYFWPDLAAICIAVWLTKRILDQLRQEGRRFIATTSTAAVITLTALCAAQTLSVIVWQDRYRREADKIMELLSNSKTGIIYYNPTWPQEAPAYTLRIPVGNKIWSSPWHMGCLKSYLLTPECEVNSIIATDN